MNVKWIQFCNLYQKGPMKFVVIVSLFFISLNAQAQGVIASGVSPAWLLDWDGGKVVTLYMGENVYTYTLISKKAPEGSSEEISMTWILKGEKGKTAVLIFEYFEPESEDSCPCLFDEGEGLNAGKAYFVTENQQFFIGCAEYTQTIFSSN